MNHGPSPNHHVRCSPWWWFSSRWSCCCSPWWSGAPGVTRARLVAFDGMGTTTGPSATELQVDGIGSHGFQSDFRIADVQNENKGFGREGMAQTHKIWQQTSVQDVTMIHINMFVEMHTMTQRCSLGFWMKHDVLVPSKWSQRLVTWIWVSTCPQKRGPWIISLKQLSALLEALVP